MELIKQIESQIHELQRLMVNNKLSADYENEILKAIESLRKIKRGL